jgi:ACS family sodium-dependent inorganic phosphate cotransporter
VDWPRRHGVVALCFLACFVAYTDRVNLSVAALAMKEELHWSQTEKGFVLSSFFVGYMAFMIAAGWLASRYGGKLVLGLAVLAWSAFTLLTPVAARASFGTLLAARIAMGVGEAAMLPGIVELYTRWVPVGERARAMARMLSGVPAGTVGGLLGAGWIVGRAHWSMVFYAFGALGLAWTAAWFARVHDDPADDMRLGPEERTLLAELRGGDASADPASRVWSLLRHRAVWAYFAAHFATTWVLYVLVSWLPSYFRDVQGMSIGSAGVVSAAPWVAMFVVANVAGPWSDRMLRRGADLTSMRKRLQSIALLGSATFLIAARGTQSPAIALVLLCGAGGALGCAWSGFAPNALDIAPRHAAVLAGVSNTIATIPGVVGVAATGWLVEVTGTYAAAFVMTAAVSGAGAIAYLLLFDARPVADSPAGTPPSSAMQR